MSRALGVGIVLAFCVAMAPASSAQAKAVGRYKDWRVFTQTVGKDTVCFAAVEASDKAPKGVNHGDVNFYVANWKSGSASNQPSLKVGYQLRSDIAPEAIIGGERFRMYTAGPEAFVPDGREKALIQALEKGHELRIEAASVKDARTAYHFSLKGSREAIDKARSLCR